MSDEPRGPVSEFEMYVGYLPVPRRFVRFVRVVVPVTLWVLALMALGWAARQGDAGDAVWEDEAPHEYRGMIIARPYAMFFDDAQPGKPEVARLLVGEGKHGVGARAFEYLGQWVFVHGYRLSRDGREMLEIASDSDAIQLVGALPRPGTIGGGPLVKTGHQTLRGEIVDSKCYLGAMKPGEGKTHKACATLCVRGGMPPMLVSVGEDGALTYTIIAKNEGEPVGEEILEYVGDEVVVEGEGFEIGGVRFVGIGRGSIRRP